MDERKKHGWPFWTTVILLLAVLYVASFGPACWLMANHLPPAAVPAVLTCYMPLMLVAGTTTTTHEMLQWYVHLWAENVEI